MPIVAGSLSCRRFKVEGKPPSDFREKYGLAIQRHAFKPPVIERDEMTSTGWVNPRRILETKFAWEEVHVGDWIVLALRNDAIRLNNRIFKARLADLMSAARKKAGRDRLSKDEKAAVTDGLQKEMARAQTPASTFREMAWNLKSGRVMFSATGEKACMQFQEFFAETFELNLVPLFPFVSAEDWARQPVQKASLDAAMPVNFSPTPGPASSRRRPEVVEMEGD